MEKGSVRVRHCGMDKDAVGEYAPTKRKRVFKAPPSQISPLLIDHVLEQVFAGASSSDLRTFRLVCREWNNAATKCLQGRLDFITIGCRNIGHSHSLHYNNPKIGVERSKTFPQQTLPHTVTPLSLCSMSSLFYSSFTLVAPAVNSEQLEKFLEIISTSTNPPFIKYEIKSKFFVPENQAIVNKFFKLASPYVQILKLSLDNCSLGDFSADFITNVSFPRLRILMVEVLRQFNLADEYEDGTTDNREMRGNAVCCRILSTIAFGAPNLESMEVSLQRKCDKEGQRRFNQDGTVNFDEERMAGLGDGGSCPCQHFHPPNGETTSLPNGNSFLHRWKKDGNRTSISRDESPIKAAIAPANSKNRCHLPFPFFAGVNDIPGGLSSSPKLKRLHLRFRNSFIHQSCVTSLLSRLANTLESFCVSEEGHGSRLMIDFPKMKRLSQFSISSTCEFEENFAKVLPISYSDQLPALTSLNLANCFGTEKRYEELFKSVTPCPSLTKLVFPSSQFTSVSLTRNIPSIFPNLKSLTMLFSTRTENLAVIETVFQNYGESLEELYLITDMDIQNQNVDHVLTGLPEDICKKMRVDETFGVAGYLEELQGMSRRASLVNLKRLKRLIFQLEHKYSRAPLMTDVTGYLAFMEMPNLQYLRFTRYGMSWDCCEALQRKCHVDVLSPHGNNVFDIETFEFDFEGI